MVFLAFALLLGGGCTGLSSDIAVVSCSSPDRVLTSVGLSSLVVVLFVVTNNGLAHSVFIVLCVDWGDSCGWKITGLVGSSGLLAMTYEVLEVLYGRHPLACVRPGNPDHTRREGPGGMGRLVVMKGFGRRGVVEGFDCIANAAAAERNGSGRKVKWPARNQCQRVEWVGARRADE